MPSATNATATRPDPPTLTTSVADSDASRASDYRSVEVAQILGTHVTSRDRGDRAVAVTTPMSRS
jgi:hypothetical protein